MKRLIIPLLLLAVLAVACVPKADPTGAVSYDNTFDYTLSEVNRIEGEFNLSYDDYNFDITSIYFNPREVPFNTDDIDQALVMLKDLAGEVNSKPDNEASLLLIKFKAGLFESEKYFKESKKKSKGQVDDGFRCIHFPEINESVGFLLKSGRSGFKSTEAGFDLFEKYPSNAEKLPVDKFWMKAMNVSYEKVVDIAAYKVKTYLEYCEFPTNSTEE